MAKFGLYLGCSSFCVAVCKDDKADVVANETGDRVSPSAVAFTERDVTVGLSAKQGLIRNASNTVQGVKHYLGKLHEDETLRDVIKKSTAKVVNRDGIVRFEVDHKETTKLITPREIATHIFRNMLAIAQAQVGTCDSYDAVLTAPLEFTAGQRDLLCAAAQDAGFSVLRVISEPCAAALAYDVGQASHSEQRRALVYRLGGAALSLTLLQVSSGTYQVLASQTRRDVCGAQFTRLLCDYFAGEFKRQHKLDPLENKRAKVKLATASETCKHVLSQQPSAQVAVDSLCEGLDFNSKVSRARFEGLISNLLSSCLAPITEVLASAGLVAADVDTVILAGGSTKIPLLQARLAAALPRATMLSSLAPDEITAVGAAKQAAILAGWEAGDLRHNEAATTVPCLPADVLLETGSATAEDEGDQESKSFTTLLYSRTPIPTRVSRDFVLGADETSCCARIYVRSSPQASPLLLGQVVLRELEPGVTLQLTVHAKGDGSLHVTCLDPVSQKRSEICIEAS